jgi:hypothetical protein
MAGNLVALALEGSRGFPRRGGIRTSRLSAISLLSAKVAHRALPFDALVPHATDDKAATRVLRKSDGLAFCYAHRAACAYDDEPRAVRDDRAALSGGSWRACADSGHRDRLDRLIVTARIVSKRVHR